jgi:16S rRNA processing protein RimM
MWGGGGGGAPPHGLDGSFVVEDPSDDPDRLVPGARVWVAGEQVAVAEAKRAGNRVVIRVDRAVPRGAVLELRASELPAAGEGSFYVFELVGLAVEEEGGRRLGRVSGVTPGVANDVLELDTGVALPMVEECVRSVDRRAGRIVVAPGFTDPG